MSSATQSPKAIRILGLCGFSQNKHVMHQRTGFMRKPLKGKVDFGQSSETFSFTLDLNDTETVCVV